jgi:hypothetical protein
MELKQLRRELTAEAVKAGICEEWREKIANAPSREYLLTLAVKGLDFVILNDFPSLRLAAEFDDIAPHYGLYVNKPIEARNQKRVIARGAQSRGRAIYNGFQVGEVYAYAGAEVEVIVEDHAYTAITVEAGAKVIVKTAGKATAKIFNHGGSVARDTTGGGTIKIY